MRSAERVRAGIVRRRLRRLGRSFDLDDLPRLLSRGISAGHPDMPEVKFGGDDARAVGAYLRTIQE